MLFQLIAAWDELNPTKIHVVTCWAVDMVWGGLHLPHWQSRVCGFWATPWQPDRHSIKVPLLQGASWLTQAYTLQLRRLPGNDDNRPGWRNTTRNKQLVQVLLLSWSASIEFNGDHVQHREQYQSQTGRAGEQMTGRKRDEHFPFPEYVTETTVLILQTSVLWNTSSFWSGDTRMLSNPAFKLARLY